MPRKTISSIIVILSVFFISSCASTSVADSNIAIYDITSPVEDQCALFFGAASTEIVSFNGDYVYWNKYDSKSTIHLNLEYNVLFPCGKNTLIVNYRGSDRTILNYKLEFDFEAGKSYILANRLGQNTMYIFERKS